MTASSLESAKDLVKVCACSRDATQANNGILIRKGKIEQLQRAAGRAIHSYADAIQTPDVAYLLGSAYLPLHNEGAGGTLYRTGDDITGFQGHQEICFKITKFYSVECDNVFTPFAICDTCQYFLDDEGCQLRHQLSDTIYARPFQTFTCIGLFDIVRPIMLWLEPDGKCVIVDHYRKTIPLPKFVAPVYPQPGDMVSVKGDQDEIWHAEV